ncbi:ead/Ea22-like family protein [Pluralibacter gergoviae]|uniref:ead/Ea22-like family protein n=1 Tax=Pluralibacter gergoviae TaxID=61647 RepID=UPI00069CF090|nr:ead/Ea22-like family protein [Pluralibacter gergoviae]
MSNIDKPAIDFSKPLETESGEPVKHICHDVIEYKCARVCVDIATGVVYSSPYVGLKIRNKEANPRAKLREQIESAADAYWQFDNGWISDMKCGDRSHEYLLFVKEPKNVLSLLDELEAAEKHIAELRDWNLGLAQESLTHQQRIAELSGQKRLIGWRASDYTDETSDPELAKNWAAAIGVLPIFEGDVNTKLSAAGISKGE